MNEYLFEVGVRAVVRVQASSPDVARKVVETVLRAPGSQEIELANRNNQRVGRDATVTESALAKNNRSALDQRSSGSSRVTSSMTSTPAPATPNEENYAGKL